MEAKILASSDGETLNVLGVGHTILVGGADTEGGYELVDVAGEPGSGVPPHVHENEDETFHVVEGRVVFMVAGDEIVGIPGTTVHLPRRVPHGFQLDGDSRCRMLLVIAPGNLGRMFRDLASLPAGPPDPAEVAAVTARYGVELL